MSPFIMPASILEAFNEFNEYQYYIETQTQDNNKED